MSSKICIIWYSFSYISLFIVIFLNRWNFLLLLWIISEQFIRDTIFDKRLWSLVVLRFFLFFKFHSHEENCRNCASNTSRKIDKKKKKRTWKLSGLYLYKWLSGWQRFVINFVINIKWSCRLARCGSNLSARARHGYLLSTVYYYPIDKI